MNRRHRDMLRALREDAAGTPTLSDAIEELARIDRLPHRAWTASERTFHARGARISDKRLPEFERHAESLQDRVDDLAAKTDALQAVLEWKQGSGEQPSREVMETAARTLLDDDDHRDVREQLAQRGHGRMLSEEQAQELAAELSEFHPRVTEAQGRRERYSVPEHGVVTQRQSTSPLKRWEGLFSYDTAWKASRDTLKGPAIGLPAEPGRSALHPGTQVVALRALDMLDRAHPIFIGRAQLEALPEGEFVQPDDARLPFDTVYFDFANAVGPAWLGDRNRFSIYGAAVTDYGEADDTLASGLTVIPFGTVSRRGDEENQYDRGDGYAMPPAAPLGMVCFGPCPVKRPTLQVGLIRLKDDDGEQRRLDVLTAVIPCRDIPIFEDGDPLPAMPGYVVTGPGKGLAALIDEDGPIQDTLDPASDRDASIFLVAAVCVVQALAALRTLYLLESANVTIDEAKVSRPVRRQAERKGIPIASTVYVRPTHVRREVRLPGSSSGSRNFSHRFERVGHYNHFTRGRIAKADHIKPCQRRDPKTGELTCPDGCRRVWIPPTVVGDEGLPFVRKSRVLSRPDPDPLEQEEGVGG